MSRDMNRDRARRALLALTVAVPLLGGCATARNPDPLEPVNRKVFEFNEAVDGALIKPVAQAYKTVVPSPIQLAVTNFFGNVKDAWSAINLFLQGRFVDGINDTMRFGTNSVFGFFGLIDMASEMGFERHNEDFGQTLGRWGFGPGPYVVLPLLGPRTVRDTIGLVPDRYVDAARLPHTDAGSWAVTALEIVTTRANLLATTQLLGEAALDRYSFVRDAYLARRLDAVYDGAPPLETFDDEADPPSTPAPKS